MNDLAKPAHRSRISCAWLGTARKGGFYIVSVYQWIAEGMTQRNADLLDEVDTG